MPGTDGTSTDPTKIEDPEMRKLAERAAGRAAEMAADRLAESAAERVAERTAERTAERAHVADMRTERLLKAMLVVLIVLLALSFVRGVLEAFR